MTTVPAYQPEKINTCLQGVGILCGLTVRVKADCTIEVSEGTAITAEGVLIKVNQHNFKSYKKKANGKLLTFFAQYQNVSFYELSEIHDNTTDPLKQQSPTDTPTRDFLEDKIVLILLDIQTGLQHFVLLSYSHVAQMKKLDDAIRKMKKQNNASSSIRLHGQKVNNKGFHSEDIEKVLFPYLQLEKIEVPRFGYKTLALLDKNKKFGLDNFQNPFLKVKNFSSIFFEYKAIIDDLIPDFCNALVQLHSLYGDILTDKSGNYWDKYRKVLIQKWDTFLEDGEQLYYVQYFYDWLHDLVKAYDELFIVLSNYHAECHCVEQISKNNNWQWVFLGPILGTQSSYKRLIFRDYFVPSSNMNGNEEQLLKIKFLHWRMMMMIWTFDLPFLKLDEKVLRDKFQLIPAKEYEDSTNYFEKTDLKNTIEDVPVKLTPSVPIYEKLENQAIPYYFPVDSDSPFSLHNYWDYQNIKNNLTAYEYSFNAIDDLDTYSTIKSANIPIAFSIQKYPFVKVEGATGRKYDPSSPSRGIKVIIKELLQKSNICMDVAFINISQEDFTKKDDTALSVWFNDNIKHINGMEHQNGAYHGQTIIFLYVGTKEQLELNECKKDETEEIEALTIVADFTLPYRLSLVSGSIAGIEIM